MLIKVNNRKIVDTTKTPVIVLFEPHEIQIIKGWQGDEDILFSRPSNWTQPQADKFMEKKKSELIALHATNQRNAAEQRMQMGPPGEHAPAGPVTCIHGVVHEKGKPTCSECAKIAEAMGVDKQCFEFSDEIQKLEQDQDGLRR